jgi:predicted transcriptional regulator
MKLADQLRKTVKGSGLTLYAVAKRSGVPYAVLYRFMSGERDLRLDTADRLCKLFSMRLTAPKKPLEG